MPWLRRFTRLGGLAAVAVSHPHMFGVQVEWSYRFKVCWVYVQAADWDWVQRDDPVITIWEEKTEVLPGVVLHFGLAATSPAVRGRSLLGRWSRRAAVR